MRKKSIFSLSVAFTVIVLLTFTAKSLARPPSTAWRSRSIDFINQRACLNRAIRAIRQEGLRHIVSSKKTDYIKGESSSTRVYILCQENVDRTYIFCAGSRASKICSSLAEYMEGQPIRPAPPPPTAPRTVPRPRTIPRY